MRARASTSGLKAGWAVTSVIRSPFIQTSRPSRIDARYSSPLRIITPSWVARVSMGNRGASGKEILTLLCRVCHYATGASAARPYHSGGGGRIDVIAPTTRAGPAPEPDRSLAARNSRSLRFNEASRSHPSSVHHHGRDAGVCRARLWRARQAHRHRAHERRELQHAPPFLVEPGRRRRSLRVPDRGRRGV